jgi:hypothetical protein
MSKLWVLVLMSDSWLKKQKNKVLMTKLSSPPPDTFKYSMVIMFCTKLKLEMAMSSVCAKLKKKQLRTGSN